jgi:hypothetical protein
MTQPLRAVTAGSHRHACLNQIAYGRHAAGRDVQVETGTRIGGHDREDLDGTSGLVAWHRRGASQIRSLYQQQSAPPDIDVHPDRRCPAGDMASGGRPGPRGNVSAGQSGVGRRAEMSVRLDQRREQQVVPKVQDSAEDGWPAGSAPTETIVPPAISTSATWPSARRGPWSRSARGAGEPWGSRGKGGGTMNTLGCQSQGCRAGRAFVGRRDKRHR